MSYELTRQRLEPLDDKDKELLLFCEAYIVQFGYSPSLREIGENVGLSCCATHGRVRKLTRLGFIRIVHSGIKGRLFTVHLPGRDPMFKEKSPKSGPLQSS